MKKILLTLTAAFAVCLAVFAGTTMCVKKQNGDILRINVDDVYEVYFEDIFNPDTSSIIPPFIESTVSDASAYAPLKFEITSDSTVKLAYGDYYSYDNPDSINIPAKVKIDGKLYSVTSIADWAFGQAGANRTTTFIGIPSSVTSIGSHAFSGCSSLTSVEIPSSITSIGREAFYGCRSLTSVEIPSSVTEIGSYAFSGCSSLTSIEIPSSVTEIGSYAFRDCSSLTSIEIPSSVTEIGEYAFSGCSKLKPEVLIYDNGTKCYGWIGNRASCISVVIPSSVTSIGSGAFEDCSSLTSIEIPSSVTEIGEYAFSGCSKLKPEVLIYDNGTKCYGWIGDRDSCISVVIPSSVTSIGSRAFYGCSSLTSVEIPSSVTSIGSRAFYGCKDLDVVIDNSKENVKFYDMRGEETTIEKSYAFYGVKSVKWLKERDEDPSVADTSAYAPLRFKITSDSTVELTRGHYYDLDSVNIPSKVKIDGKIYDVTSIGENAFLWCSNLTDINIPESVTKIGTWAFRDCYSLTSVNISKYITEIGSSVFYSCSKLKPELLVYDNGTKCYGWIGNSDSCISVVIPETVITIADSAFAYCYNMTNIEIPNNVTSIGVGAFSGCSKLNPEVLIYDNGTKCYGWIGDRDSCISVVIPSSVTSIGSGAFAYCRSLTSVEIPSSVTSIGSETFVYCSSLTSIDIPSSVTEIGEYAFAYCSSLTSVEIPSSVTSIGSDAFAYCRSLTSIDIPSSVTEIGEYAFYWCNNLDIVIDNSKENVKFYRKEYDWNQDMYIVIVEETTMEESYAFNGVKSVTWKE